MRSRYLSTALLAAGLMGALAAPVGAVVINVGDGSGNVTAPVSDPGWSNVGVAGAGTAVYLGNRWVITANHVGVQPVVFGGTTYAPEPRTATQLKNTGNVTGTADLIMYRLASSPNLPSLAISAAAPAIGSVVTMIGDGVNRTATEAGWNNHQVNGQPVWTPTALPSANELGYNLLSTREMRWGQSQVALGDSVSTGINGTTVVQSTLFSSNSTITSQGQAEVGDSGGGVFSFAGGKWMLAGIMVAEQPISGQPLATAVFGDKTQYAELHFYSSQITSLVNGRDPALAWQNPTNALDVNNDQAISPLDALSIINELNKNGSHALVFPPLAANAPPPYYDVNGDGSVSPIDALGVINQLNAFATAKSAVWPLAANASVVPEPSTLLLGSFGFVGWLLGLYRVRSRRT